MPDPSEFDVDFEKVTNGGVASVDEVLDCLTDPFRRLVVYYCREERVATVEELATQIAARDSDVPPREVSDDQRKKYEIRLVHTHLPRLTSSKIIEYDQRSQTVRYDDPPRMLDWLLQALARLEARNR